MPQIPKLHHVSSILLLLPLMWQCATPKVRKNFVMVRPTFSSAKSSAEVKIQESAKAAVAAAGLPTEARRYITQDFKSSGIAIGTKWISASYMEPFRPVDDEAAIAEKGKTTGSDFQLHLVLGSFGLDLATQSMKGFHVEAPDPLPLDFPGYEVFPDMKIKRNSVTFFYMSDPESFSYDTAFTQTEYKPESGGTWLLMLSADEQSATNMPTEDPTIDPRQQVKSMQNVAASLLGGFGLTGYTGFGLYASIALATGPSFHRMTAETRDGTVQGQYESGYKNNVRMIFGIDRGFWFAGSRVWQEGQGVLVNDVDLMLQSSQIEGFFGMRL